MSSVEELRKIMKEKSRVIKANRARVAPILRGIRESPVIFCNNTLPTLYAFVYLFFYLLDPEEVVLPKDTEIKQDVRHLVIVVRD